MGLAQQVSLALVAAVLVWFAGLVWFVAHLPRSAPVVSEASGGIVALTGGEQRLSAGMELLNARMGERLLVTGVHQAAARAHIKRYMGGSPDLFDCCVDLGREAVDTIGNAREAAEWTARHGYRSIRVVTASYHLPRSLVELGEAMPGVRLIPHPVLTDGVKLDQWWRWPGTSRLLAWEYTKYLFSLARIEASRVIGAARA